MCLTRVGQLLEKDSVINQGPDPGIRESTY
jgi:hypothetical protein